MSPKARSPVAFGPYVITRRIARGGMAEIYRARTRASGGQGARWVAVKMMRSSLGHEELRLRLFDREARIASRLNHENVVPVYEYGQEMGRPYLSMEYVLGRDLSHLLKNEKKGRDLMPFEIGLYVGLQASRGLGHAHRLADEMTGDPLGIVHRDISPGNVMVGYDGDIKVLDFGVARINETQGFHTQTGTLRGKFAYMSPEQTIGDELDARSDVFSLGTVLYELLTGINCFRAQNPIATLERVQGLRPVPPSRANREIPKEVDRILARCLAKDRRRRFKDGIAVAEALGEFLDKQRFDGRQAVVDHMEAEFSWEKHEEQSELHREEEEVALFDVVDFALLSNPSELDAKNLAVSTEEEASQMQVEDVARRQETADSEVFEEEGEAESATLARPDPEDEPYEEPEEDATVAQPLPFEDPHHGRGQQVEMSSLLEPSEAAATLPPPAHPLASPAGIVTLPPDDSSDALTPPATRAKSLQRTTERPGSNVVIAALVAAIVLLGAGVWWLYPTGQKVGYQAPPTKLDPVTITLGGPPAGGDPEAAAVAAAAGADEPVDLPEGDGRADEVVEPPAAAPPAAAPAPPPRSRVRPVSLRARSPTTKAKARPAKRRRRAKKGLTGFLNVGAKPWAQIQIDGKAWPYQTPQAGIELKAGKHRVTLHNPETGVTRTTAVYIKPGAYRTVMMDMRKNR